MPLQELRQARHLSQEHLATILSTKQANVSLIECRADVYISTLRSYIEAMGGELEKLLRASQKDRLKSINFKAFDFLLKFQYQ